MSLLSALSQLQINESVLMEVPPSPSNVALPVEADEHWVAVCGGFFTRPDTDGLISHVKTSGARKTILKKPKARNSVRRAYTIPEKIPKKDRREHHELLGKRVYVIWDEVQGPTRYYGTVVKFDSDRKGAPFYV
eukprot:7391349-Prymnesium_polylepis.1